MWKGGTEQSCWLLGAEAQASSGSPAERPELFDDACDIEPVELSTEGTLFTFTTQEFPPPDPYKGKREDFRPYITGYIELPDDGILVEGGLIVTADPGRLTIGQKNDRYAERFF